MEAPMAAECALGGGEVFLSSYTIFLSSSLDSAGDQFSIGSSKVLNSCSSRSYSSC